MRVQFFEVYGNIYLKAHVQAQENLTDNHYPRHPLTRDSG